MIGQLLEMPRIESVIEENYGKFVIEPLERGYGHTLGNSLRRILLSSMPGAAITHIKIEGILHEFSSIPGVLEDTTDIILNLKQIRFKMHTDVPKVLRLEVKGEKEVLASDILDDAEVEILTPQQRIATLTRKTSKLVMELYLEKGIGYVPYDKQEIRENTLGLIPIDSIFTPIKRVNYCVEDTRVAQTTNYDRLIIEIWTDGTIEPIDALSSSSKLLQDYFKHLSDVQFLMGTASVSGEKDEVSSKTVDELGLSIRSLNCLKRAGIKTLGELMHLTEDDLMRMKNFGSKSLDEIKEKLVEYGHNISSDMENE